MTHRRNVVMIDADEPPAAIIGAVLASPYTRLPLWRGEPDNIVGVIHAKALLRAVHARGGDLEGLDVVALAAKPWFVPESTHAAGPVAGIPAAAGTFRLSSSTSTAA